MNGAKELPTLLRTIQERILLHRVSFLYSVSYIFQLGGRTVAEIYAASVLGPMAFGIWKIWQLFITFGATSFGVSNGAGRIIPHYLGLGQTDKALESQNTTLSVTGAAAFVISLGCGMFIYRFRPDLEITTRPILTIIAFGLLLFFENLNRSALASLRSFQKFKALVFIQTITGLLYLVTAGLIYKFGFLGLVAGFASASFCSFTLSCISMKSPVRFTRYSKDALKELLAHGLPLALLGYTDAALSNSDRLLLTAFMMGSAVGDYSLAMLVYGIVMIVPITLMQYFFPAVAMEFAREPFGKKCREALSHQVFLSKLVVVCLIVGAAGALYPIVTHFLPKYRPGLIATYILLLGLYPQALVQAYSSLIIVAKKTQTLIKLQLMALAFNFVLGYLLILLLKRIEAVAISTSITFFLEAVFLKGLVRDLFAGTALQPASPPVEPGRMQSDRAAP